MNDAPREPLRIALLHESYASASPDPVSRLAGALQQAGHRPCLISSHRGEATRTVENGVPVIRKARPRDRLLRARGFPGSLAAVPPALRALAAGAFDVAHAFSFEDAVTALLWRGVLGRPAVFTPLRPLTREHLAGRRLRMRMVTAATEESDAVIAPDEEVGVSLLKWMAIEAPVIETRDAAAYERVYRTILTGPAGRTSG